MIGSMATICCSGILIILFAPFYSCYTWLFISRPIRVYESVMCRYYFAMFMLSLNKYIQPFLILYFLNSVSLSSLIILCPSSSLQYCLCKVIDIRFKLRLNKLLCHSSLSSMRFVFLVTEFGLQKLYISFQFWLCLLQLELLPKRKSGECVSIVVLYPPLNSNSTPNIILPSRMF